MIRPRPELGFPEHGVRVFRKQPYNLGGERIDVRNPTSTENDLQTRSAKSLYSIMH
jgi:hypothetical protein